MNDFSREDWELMARSLTKELSEMRSLYKETLVKHKFNIANLEAEVKRLEEELKTLKEENKRQL